MGYDKSIKIELENLGGKVSMFNDRPYNGFYDFLKTISINFTKIYQNINWYFRLSRLKLSSFNTVFVIRGEDIPNFVFNAFKKAGLNMILYQWDSVRNYDYLHQKRYFNNISTFDKKDAILHGFDYLPLFYRREYEKLEKTLLNEKTALFVGTYQDKRYRSILDLKDRLKGIGINTIVIFRIPFYHQIKLKLKGIKLKKKYLVYKTVTLSEILKLYSKSDIIIDAANENQSGLTMRTFEALGAKKTLLTNNTTILEEPFFDSKKIKLFNEKFSLETFNLGTDIDLVKEQRIDNWLLRLLEKE